MTVNKAFFNNKARAWAKRRRPDMENIDLMLRLSDLRPGLRMLDAGCGTGVLEPFLLRYYPEHIYGVDYAENMIRVAKEAFYDPRVEFVCQDILRLAPRKYACDFCVCYNTFPHFEEPARVCAHLARLVRPGGRLTVSHTQGKRSASGGLLPPGFPAQGMVKLLSPYFRPDVVIDNNIMFLISGIRLR